ncbi:hypothetical protein L0244_38195 [bacterium]|nr:hypothetical protein [bacterium]
MKKHMMRVVIFLLCLPLTLGAQGNSFDKIRYQGGTLKTKVDSDEWKNNLAVTSDKIILKLKDGQGSIVVKIGCDSKAIQDSTILCDELLCKAQLAELDHAMRAFLRIEESGSG